MTGRTQTDLPAIVVTSSSLFLLILNLITPISSHDIGFDIVTGRLIRETLSIPSVDVFSHTFSGSPWFIYQWLPDIIFSLIYDITGANGLVLFKVVVIFLAILLVFLVAARSYGAVGASVAVCLSYLPLSYSSDVRTYIFGHFFMAVVILLLNTQSLSIEKYKGRLIALMVTIFLWSNVHVSVFLGCIYIVVYGLVNSSGNSRLRNFIYVGAAALSGLLLGMSVASIINPHGLNLWKRFFLMLTDPYFRRVYAELRPFFSLNGYPPPFLIGMAFSTLLVVISGKKNIFHIGAYLVFALLTILMARNAGLLAFVMLIPIACGVSVFINFFPRRKKTIELVLVLAAFIIIVLSGIGQQRGLGFARGFYPNKVYSFIRKVDMPGKVFNDMWYGGSFILEFYPDRKVFVDSRTALSYPPEFLKYDYAIIKFAAPGWEEMLLKYDVNWILLISGRYDKLREALFKSPDWIPLYKDDVSDIFLRKTEENRLFYERFRKMKKSGRI